MHAIEFDGDLLLHNDAKFERTITRAIVLDSVWTTLTCCTLSKRQHARTNTGERTPNSRCESPRAFGLPVVSYTLFRYRDARYTPSEDPGRDWWVEHPACKRSIPKDALTSQRRNERFRRKNPDTSLASFCTTARTAHVKHQQLFCRHNILICGET